MLQYGDDDYPLPYFENRKGQQPSHEAISLQDYRQRYACYRMDAALQKLHAKFPMIAIWWEFIRRYEFYVPFRPLSSLSVQSRV